MFNQYHIHAKRINKFFCKASLGNPRRRFLNLFFVFWLLMLAILFVSGGYSKNQDPKLISGFEAKIFDVKLGESLPYRLLRPVPDDLQSNQKFPAILFLHGSGERGSDNGKQLNYIAQIFDDPAMRQKYPCFVIAPQCPTNQNWVVKESYSGSVLQSAEPTKPLGETMELIHALSKDLPIDSGRMYVIGISSGGSGVWDLLARYPRLFAAAVPFSGSGDDKKAYLMVKTPIWAFHGGRDILVNPNTTRMMIQAIRKAGGDPRYTEYPNLFHNTWNKTFHDPAFFQWLFAQKQVEN
ncbi:MAG TPA: phospholipase [Firmicutes bacterium]|nr:phospholipase [Bacillota bacterium]